MAASLRHAGRKVQARAYDAMIAATPLANGLPLYTVHPAEVEGVDGLDLRAIDHPGKRSASTHRCFPSSTE